MWLINDFRDFEEAKKLLTNATPISSFQDLILKKDVTPLSVYYGLFNNDELVAYYWLMAFHGKTDKYRGHEYHVADHYQRQGIGTYLYSYILLEDKLTLVSDRSHTQFSNYIWAKLLRMEEIKVGIFNALDESVDYSKPLDKSLIYDNDHMHYIACAKE
jgi:GNAT superfamily N-acetyltransferase